MQRCPDETFLPGQSDLDLTTVEADQQTAPGLYAGAPELDSPARPVTPLAAKPTLESLLIGEGSVLVRCGEVLTAKGHRIKAVVSSDVVVRSWATKAGVQRYDLEEALGLGSQLECDVLLSIGNYTVVPEVLLTLAKRMGVNYHYGPLPEYSGLHVPSWAIVDRATEYAITWHRIGGLVDGGGILKRIPVPIDASDTALSLGLKCDELAVQSFATLIDELAERRETELLRTSAGVGIFHANRNFLPKA